MLAFIAPLLLGALSFLGLAAGYYGPAVAIALVSSSLALLAVGFVSGNAQHVQAAETDAARVKPAAGESDDGVIRLAEHAAVMLWMSDGAGNRTWFNRPWQDFVGRSMQQEIGDGWIANVHDDDVKRCVESWQAARPTRRAVQVEYRLRRYDGVYRAIVELGLPRGAGESATGYIGICLDLTDQREIAERLSDARAMVEATDRLKGQFLGMISHELRTPLNTVLGYARMLRTDAIPADRRQHAIEIIEKNAESEHRLIGNLLDLAEVADGRLRLEIRPVALVGPIQEALESLRHAAQAKQIAVEVGGDTSLIANGDPDRLRQVFWNVFSNALKFTPAGGRVVTTIAQQTTHACVIVRDSGTGISRDFLPIVFQPFRQADRQFSRQFSGLGLGLTISRHLLELHGGTMSVTSQGANLGTTVEVRLPRHLAEATAPTL